MNAAPAPAAQPRRNFLRLLTGGAVTAALAAAPGPAQAARPEAPDDVIDGGTP